jgi:large subunit ribosomal protein L2
MRKLFSLLPKNSGRNSSGKLTVRHQGGRAKRFLRDVDFKRDKKDVWARVEEIAYDPNRNADIAQIVYEDGERRFVLAPLNLKVGAKIIASESASIEIGNSLPLEKIPAGIQIHNIEIKPGKGGQIGKAAGAAAIIQGKEGDYMLVKLPSSEVRRFNLKCWATIGQVGNIEKKTENLGKAGRSRWRGIRPSVRGVAMSPNSHPHGGGEGRSGIGLKYPKTPWGKPAVGKTRRPIKYSDNLIVSPRKKGPHVG